MGSAGRDRIRWHCGAAAAIAGAGKSDLDAFWAVFLSRIVNPIVLGIVFYAIVTPTGIVMRAMGKDLLRSRFESKISSYWISRDPAGPTPESMKNQF